MHLTIINHNTRKQLGLGCFQYMVLDILYQKKQCSQLYISSVLGIGEQLVVEKLESLSSIDPQLVQQEGEVWSITPFADKVMSGDMFVKEKPKKVKPKSDLCEKVIELFNVLNGTRYEPDTYSALIQAIQRKKPDITVEHFESVIKHKAITWGNKPEMKEYNRPKTLFGNKFLSYLDDARVYWEEQVKQQTDYSEITR